MHNVALCAGAFEINLTKTVQAHEILVVTALYLSTVGIAVERGLFPAVRAVTVKCHAFPDYVPDQLGGHPQLLVQRRFEEEIAVCRVRSSHDFTNVVWRGLPLSSGAPADCFAT